MNEQGGVRSDRPRTGFHLQAICWNQDSASWNRTRQWLGKVEAVKRAAWIASSLAGCGVAGTQS